jgi:predicted Ser/Thr protein kinase
LHAINSKLLKKDTFGQVRLEYRGPDRVIMRDLGPARWWARDMARRLLAREARALTILDGETGVPTLLDARRDTLVRAFIEGAPMHDARPQDPAYFRQAGKLLRRLHRLGVVHNDLAKEANWLVTSDGQPALVDFQLAWCPPRRGRLFRLLAREDLRHLLKHKRTYCPMRLTTRERHILARPSVPSRVWMRTGKPLYLLITRRILGWADREGAADR